MHRIFNDVFEIELINIDWLWHAIHTTFYQSIRGEFNSNIDVVISCSGVVFTVAVRIKTTCEAFIFAVTTFFVVFVVGPSNDDNDVIDVIIHIPYSNLNWSKFIDSIRMEIKSTAYNFEK